jgi:hypothetical protein
MRKVTLLVGFGAGYVLGARAGRARYEQIKRQFEGLMGKPAVQDAVQTVKHEAEIVLDKAKTTVTDKVGGTDTNTAGTSVGAGTMADSTAGRGGTGRLDPYPS